MPSYCEFVPGLIHQPVNVASNLAFFLAAFGGWRLARAQPGARRPAVVALLLVLLLIGAGSTAFHAFPGPATLLADVLPILLFQLIYVPAYARRAMHRSRLQAGGLLLLFVALVGVAEAAPPDWLNGSVGYLPALAFLFGLGIYHWHARQSERGALLLAAGLFLLSLLCRTADAAACAALPVGLHFIWHLLNGAVLYLALRALIAAR